MRQQNVAIQLYKKMQICFILLSTPASAGIPCFLWCMQCHTAARSEKAIYRIPTSSGGAQTVQLTNEHKMMCLVFRQPKSCTLSEKRVAR